MRVLITRLAAALALGVSAGAAIADVAIVNFGTVKYFYGHLGAAATATGPDAYIQCQLDHATLSCAASDQTGAFASCTTTDPNIKKMFPMMDKSSLVQVFYDSAGNCTKMAVVNLTRDLRLSSPAGSFNYSVPISVDLVARTARGSIGARPAVPDNNNEGIWCMERSDGLIQCVVNDSNRQSVNCVSFGDHPQQTIADQQIAVAGINEFSYISITFDNATPQPTCLTISVLNASYLAPR